MTIMLTQWANVVLGLWIIVLPFIGFSASGFTWAMIITGALVAILGIWGAQEVYSERETGRMMHRMGHR